MPETKGWRRRLDALGEPVLQPITGNLAELKQLLTADEPDVAAFGPLLAEVEGRTEAVVSGTATL